MVKNMSKLLILGLDGATWRVLKRLIQNNELPTIKSLVENGVHAELESTFPPKTGPAWLSMATGKNPGKTGVFDFLTKKDDDVSYGVVNSSHFRENGSYWDILNDHGYRTYLLNHPMLYPFYDIEGVIVGGMGLPDDADITYPKDLEEKLHEITNSYWTRVDWHSSEYEDKQKFIKDLKTLIEKQSKAVEYFLEDDWNLFLHVNSATDYLQHVMMEDWENSSSKFHEDFIDIWKLVDKKIKIILNKFDDDDVNVFIVSDHGFGLLEKKFNLGRLLYEHGLVKKTNFSDSKKSIKEKLNLIYKKTPFSKYIDVHNSKISKVFEKLFNIKPGISPDIEREESKVIPTITSKGSAGIHINRDKGDYEEIKLSVINCIKEAEKKYDLNIKIYEADDLYHGEKIDLAPDLFLENKNPKIAFHASNLNGDMFSESLNRTGDHRMEGIFIASGPDIEHIEEMKDYKIYDIAPTILHYYGISIPEDVDGRVLKEIFDKNSEQFQKEIEFSKAREEEKLKQTIKDLEL